MKAQTKPDCSIKGEQMFPSKRLLLFQLPASPIATQDPEGAKRSLPPSSGEERGSGAPVAPAGVFTPAPAPSCAGMPRGQPPCPARRHGRRRTRPYRSTLPTACRTILQLNPGLGLWASTGRSPGRLQWSPTMVRRCGAAIAARSARAPRRRPGRPPPPGRPRQWRWGRAVPRLLRPPRPAPNRPEQGPAPPPPRGPAAARAARPGRVTQPRAAPARTARLPSTSTDSASLRLFFWQPENKQSKAGRCLTKQDTGQTFRFAVCATGPVRSGAKAGLPVGSGNKDAFCQQGSSLLSVLCVTCKGMGYHSYRQSYIVHGSPTEEGWRRRLSTARDDLPLWPELRAKHLGNGPQRMSD